jgi:hypothetical protein
MEQTFPKNKNLPRPPLLDIIFVKKGIIATILYFLVFLLATYLVSISEPKSDFINTLKILWKPAATYYIPIIIGTVGILIFWKYYDPEDFKKRFEKKKL